MRALKRWINRFLVTTLGLLFITMFLANQASAIYVYYGGQPHLQSQSQSKTSLLSNYSGAYNTVDSPPSPVIAVNSKDVVQLVNNEYVITNRSGVGVSGTANSLTHTSAATYLSDPQVMWDPLTSRFYYSFLENNGVNGVANEGIGWGFSKTATPATAADFCSYFSGFNYGSTSFPDRQFLGDTRDYLMWGNQRISLSTGGILGSDAAWVNKPAAGATCPSASTFKSGVQSLTNASSSGLYVQQPLTFPYYPVAARQTDASTTGWLVGLPSYVSANYLTLIQASETSSGLAFAAPSNVAVPQYNCPSSVAQGGLSLSGSAAPSLEANISLNGMYMGIDPRFGSEALWTTDTIATNSSAVPAYCQQSNGTSVRWYEINPAASSTYQEGTVSSPSLNYFNSAIAPDRAVSGTTAKYGSDMALTFNSDSTTSYPQIWYVGKEGSLPAFVPTLIKSSNGIYEDFSCFEAGVNNTCRFGDWPGAAPDPAQVTSTSKFGTVWLSNEWNVAQSPVNYESPIWRTEVAQVGFR